MTRNIGQILTDLAKADGQLTAIYGEPYDDCKWDIIDDEDGHWAIHKETGERSKLVDFSNGE